MLHIVFQNGNGVNMKNFSINGTVLNFHQNDEKRDVLYENFSHYKLYRQVLDYLGSIGFYVSEDKEIKKRYPSLSKDRNRGRYGNLEFKSERYPAGFKIEFFQNVVFENPHGGEYDSNKLEKMPYLVRKQFELTIKKISKFLIDKGIPNTTKPVYKNAKAKIKQHYVESLHHPQKDINFLLSDLDGQTFEPYNSKDRDGKIIHNGEIKCFRDYNGYLYRGKIYHNINNMWWVIINANEIRNIASFEFFDLTPDEYRGRKHIERIPESHKNKRNELSAATSKELINELRRRGRIKKGKIVWNI